MLTPSRPQKVTVTLLDDVAQMYPNAPETRCGARPERQRCNSIMPCCTSVAAPASTTPELNNETIATVQQQARPLVHGDYGINQTGPP